MTHLFRGKLGTRTPGFAEPLSKPGYSVNRIADAMDR